MYYKALFLLLSISLCSFAATAQNNQSQSNFRSKCIGSVSENNSNSLIPIPNCKITVSKNDGSSFTIFSDSIGNFEFAIDSNSNYTIRARSDERYTEGDIYKKGKQKYFTSKNLFISSVGLTTSKNFECIIKLDTLFTGCHYTYPFIEFENTSSILSPESKIVLNTLTEIMNENPTFSIEIKSFSDYKGNTSFNQRISQERADKVLKYLTEKGIDKNRLLAKGYGESSPKIITAENYRYIPIKYKDDFPIGAVLDEKFIESLKNEELKEVALKLNRRTEYQVLCTEWSAGKAPDYCVKSRTSY